MLNGIDPIIIFQFSVATPQISAQLAKIPLVRDIPTLIDQPPIPLYLSENLTGVFVDAQSKTIDARTDMETPTGKDENGENKIQVTQKGIASVVSVDLKANKNSIGLTLLGALSDLILEKMSSKEYYITYLNGSATIFRGVLHSLSFSEDSDSDLVRIRMELSRGDTKNLPSTTNNTNPNVNRVIGPRPT